jgi:putative tryptophan/tyrosine transport system substrate-binding protein
MRRREFVSLLVGAAAAWPVAGRAQADKRIPVIGYLNPSSAADDQRLGYGAAFREGLSDLGYVVGESLRIEARYADRQFNRLQTLAAELVGLNVDVIAAVGSEALYATHAVSATVPIVTMFGAVVGSGLFRSLAHPEGHVTGVAIFYNEIAVKRLELLKQAQPSLRKVGLIFQGRNDGPMFQRLLYEAKETATRLDVGLAPIGVPLASEVERALSDAPGGPVDGFVMADSWLMADSALIADIAQRRALPSIGPLVYPSAGGLLGYGSDFVQMSRRAAIFVDKILKGAKPGDIPVELSTTFKTIVNLKTAGALGLEIPPALLAGADEVIE